MNSVQTQTFPLKEMEVVKRILTFAMDNCVFLLL